MQHTVKKYNTMQKLITKKKPKLKDNIKKKTEKTMCMLQHTSEQTCEAYEQCINQHSAENAVLENVIESARHNKLKEIKIKSKLL